jgi:radical SAM protein with 4Fe4S-binding SPASM domain
MPPVEVLSEESFWSRITEKATASREPIQAMIELTYGCNLRCVHCFNPTHQARGEQTTGEIIGVLDQLADAGCLSVGFTGGEIFTRSDVFEIFAHAKASGFAVTILTNATMITAERADRIRALRPLRVEISIYGATRQTYEAVTRIPGSFHAFLTGVQHLRDRHVPLAIKMPVMTLNQHEVQLAKTMIEGWGIKFVYSTEITPRVDGSLEPLEYRIPARDVIRIDEAVLGSRKWRAEGGGEQAGTCQAQAGLFTCTCGTRTLAVTPYGRMNLCLAFPTPQYDLHAGSVAEGWKALKDLVDRASATPGDAYECPDCPVRSHCGQGPSDAWLETGRMDVCLPYHKELATLHKEAAQRNSTDKQT